MLNVTPAAMDTAFRGADKNTKRLESTLSKVSAETWHDCRRGRTALSWPSINQTAIDTLCWCHNDLVGRHLRVSSDQESMEVGARPKQQQQSSLHSRLGPRRWLSFRRRRRHHSTRRGESICC